ncbi:MAG: cell division protein FtsQ/DivIB [Rickettsiales bacterium]
MTKRRARVQQKGVPTRAQAVAEFGRKKAKLRRQQWKRRALLMGGIGFATYAVIGTYILYHNGRIQHAYEVAGQSFWQLTADAGFTLRQVTLAGRTHADTDAVKAALGVMQGTPILSVSLADMRERLSHIPEVKTVTITRALPDRIAITLTERVPAALWQHGGQSALVDAEGVVLAADKYKGAGGLPVIVGDDAAKHVGELIALLDSTPALKPDVVAAVRVGARRWNVQLKRDIVVMLPEDAPGDAWKRFATLVDNQALLSKAVRSIDMRMEDRVFIMPADDNKPAMTLTNARDT